MEKLRILFINSVVDYGSTGKIVRDLAEGLKALGHEILIAYGRKNPKDNIDTFNISDKSASVYHLLMTRVFDRHGLHSKNATEKLINKIKEFNPHLVHLHNLHGYYLNYPMLMEFLKTQKQIKIVWTLHDFWAVSGSSAYFSYYGCKLWDKGCIKANNPKTYPKSNFLLREVKNFNLKKQVFTGFDDMKIVTVSNWQKEIIKDTFLNEYPIRRIYNGINFDKYDEVKNTPKIENMLFGVANDWNDEKNLKDYIKLAEILPKNFSMTLVGLDDNQIKNLPKNIKGHKRTSNQKELLELYAKSSVFLNLSLQETMGMTTVEALASGTPVVVYDQTAVPEIIDGSVGEIVKAGEIEGLLNAIKRIINRNISQETCYNFAKKHYNVIRMIDEYEKLFDFKTGL